MLIRWATEAGLLLWYALATEVSPIFRHPADMGKDPEFISYAESKTGKFEALTAADYRSGANDHFPGAPIDCRISEPAPYEDYGEFIWFIRQMKKELQKTPL